MHASTPDGAQPPADGTPASAKPSASRSAAASPPAKTPAAEPATSTASSAEDTEEVQESLPFAKNTPGIGKGPDCPGWSEEQMYDVKALVDSGFTEVCFEGLATNFAGGEEHWSYSAGLGPCRVNLIRIVDNGIYFSTITNGEGDEYGGLPGSPPGVYRVLEGNPALADPQAAERLGPFFRDYGNITEQLSEYGDALAASGWVTGDFTGCTPGG